MSTVSSRPQWGCLATDLDGTFIPLDNEPDNRRDLAILVAELARDATPLVFVTGRHYALTLEAIQAADLPRPEWMICDVGTSIYHRTGSNKLEPIQAYQDHLDVITAPMPVRNLRDQLCSVRGVRLQESEKQGRFKLSYYTDAKRLPAIVEEIQRILSDIQAPWAPIESVDPFTGDGLIDLLPAKVSKAHALAWWIEYTNTDPDMVLFSGDSGNDEAVLTAGYRSILVGNADRALAEHVSHIHQQNGWVNRLFLARQKATSGVLEGYRWFSALVLSTDQ